MTKIINYQCNLCREDHDGGERMHGVYFLSSGIELRRPAETEVHLCYHCMNMLRELAQTEGETE